MVFALKWGNSLKTTQRVLFTKLGRTARNICGFKSRLCSPQALKTAPTAAQDGGAAFKGGIVGALSALTQKEDFSNIESDKVKHGTGEK